MNEHVSAFFVCEFVCVRARVGVSGLYTLDHVLHPGYGTFSIAGENPNSFTGTSRYFLSWLSNSEQMNSNSLSNCFLTLHKPLKKTMTIINSLQNVFY